MSELELVLDLKETIGEGPCWDAAQKLFYWVDILEMKVHVFDPGKNENRTIHIGQYVGAVVPRKSGGVVLALHHGFYALDLQTEKLALLRLIEDLPKEIRFNDGKCDALGRFWAGTMELKGSTPEGTLYCLETDLTVRAVLNQVSCSNGIAWSADNKKMYYIDSPTKQVVAFDYDLNTGTISNRRVSVNIPDGGGMPDGMTIDAEGMIWVAQWGGFQVSRWNPETGEFLDSVPVPAAQVTSCTFGGEHFDELYITTARLGLNQQQLEDHPHAGGLFRIKTKVKGLPTFAFGG